MPVEATKSGPEDMAEGGQEGERRKRWSFSIDGGAATKRKKKKYALSNFLFCKKKKKKLRTALSFSLARSLARSLPPSLPHSSLLLIDTRRHELPGSLGSNDFRASVSSTNSRSPFFSGPVQPAPPESPRVPLPPALSPCAGRCDLPSSPCRLSSRGGLREGRAGGRGAARRGWGPRRARHAAPCPRSRRPPPRSACPPQVSSRSQTSSF